MFLFFVLYLLTISGNFYCSEIQHGIFWGGNYFGSLSDSGIFLGFVRSPMNVFGL